MEDTSVSKVTFEDEGAAYLSLIEGLVVDTVDKYRDVCDWETAIKIRIPEIKSYFIPVIKKQSEALVEARKQEQRACAGFENALVLVRKLRQSYEDFAKAKALEQEREINAVKEEAARREAEKLAASFEQAEPELAQLVRESYNVPQIKVEPDIPKIKGFFNRENWHFEVLDSAKVKLEFMTPDVDKIQAIVDASGNDAAKMIGDGSIRVWSTSTPTSRLPSRK